LNSQRQTIENQQERIENQQETIENQQEMVQQILSSTNDFPANQIIDDPHVKIP
jgi:hypothetical protein